MDPKLPADGSIFSRVRLFRGDFDEKEHSALLQESGIEAFLDRCVEIAKSSGRSFTHFTERCAESGETYEFRDGIFTCTSWSRSNTGDELEEVSKSTYTELEVKQRIFREIKMDYTYGILRSHWGCALHFWESTPFGELQFGGDDCDGAKMYFARGGSAPPYPTQPPAKINVPAISRLSLAVLAANIIAFAFLWAVVSTVITKCERRRNPEISKVTGTEWKTLITTKFADSSPFSVKSDKKWSSTLGRGRYAVRLTDLVGVWFKAAHSKPVRATRITAEGRIENEGAFARRASDATWGLWFRQSDQGHYGVFIRGDGSWRFVIHRNDEFENALERQATAQDYGVWNPVHSRLDEEISPWELSPVVRRAGEFNVIHVDAVGSRIVIQVNGEILGEFDNGVLESGDQSLFCYGFGDTLFEFKSYELLEK